MDGFFNTAFDMWDEPDPKKKFTKTKMKGKKGKGKKKAPPKKRATKRQPSPKKKSPIMKKSHPKKKAAKKGKAEAQKKKKSRVNSKKSVIVEEWSKSVEMKAEKKATEDINAVAKEAAELIITRMNYRNQGLQVEVDRLRSENEKLQIIQKLRAPSNDGAAGETDSDFLRGQLDQAMTDVVRLQAELEQVENEKRDLLMQLAASNAKVQEMENTLAVALNSQSASATLTSQPAKEDNPSPKRTSSSAIQPFLITSSNSNQNGAKRKSSSKEEKHHSMEVDPTATDIEHPDALAQRFPAAFPKSPDPTNMTTTNITFVSPPPQVPPSVVEMSDEHDNQTDTPRLGTIEKELEKSAETEIINEDLNELV